MDLPSNWLIAAGAVTASLIAGLFSFLSLILSKEQKISEFRQNWIDNVQEDLSTYISSLYSIEYITKVYNYEHKEKISHVDLEKNYA